MMSMQRESDKHLPLDDFLKLGNRQEEEEDVFVRAMTSQCTNSGDLIERSFFTNDSLSVFQKL